MTLNKENTYRHANMEEGKIPEASVPNKILQETKEHQEQEK